MAFADAMDPSSLASPKFEFMAKPEEAGTLLDAFLLIARSSQLSDRTRSILELGSESWTYAELDTISSALAISLRAKYGEKPTIAIISENHPYTFALLFAVWKLGGIVAPMDWNGPEGVVRKMLENVKAGVVVFPEGAKVEKVVQDMGIPYIAFKLSECTISALTKTYGSPNAVELLAPPPSDSIALYLHTSSAHSPSTVKTVPLTHVSVMSGARGRVGFWKGVSCTPASRSSSSPEMGMDVEEGKELNEPVDDLRNLRILGWSPWSHIIGLSCDIGAGTLLTAGTYVFGVRPSCYPQGEVNVNDSIDVGKALSVGVMGGGAAAGGHHLDVPTQLLHTALSSSPPLDIFAGVPWVLEGFMKTCTFQNSDRPSALNNDSPPETTAERNNALVGALKRFKLLSSGGAKMNDPCGEWMSRHGLKVIYDIGMTELGGPIFHSANTQDSPEGWDIEDCLIPDAKLSLVGEDGNQLSILGLEDGKVIEGELTVKSSLITRGYIGSGVDNSSFKRLEDGMIEFRTGDVYAFARSGENKRKRIVWIGRKEDYIQISSGESLDPRTVEAQLDASPYITKSVVVGDNFLRGSSRVVCAIIQPSSPSALSKPNAKEEILKSVASSNALLAPPLRISWSRVLILGRGEEVPMTRKGAVWRKMLEEMFGERVGRLVRGESSITEEEGKKGGGEDQKEQERKKTKDEVVGVVESVVVDALKISKEVLNANEGATFAELGMDSCMSTKIVNMLNRLLGLNLPLNTCHTHVDLDALRGAVLEKLGVSLDVDEDEVRQADKSTGKEKERAQEEKEDIVIIGQAMRLPGDINDPASLWEAFLAQRSDLMTPFPPSRWDHSSFYRSPSSVTPSNPLQPGDIVSNKAGWIDIASFDHAFFGLGASEAYLVAPSNRLSLEVAFEALENANLPSGRVKGSMMGVFVANQMDEGYLTLLYAEKGWGAYTRFYATGVATSTGCGRLSYLLDIHGPSITVDTACSSGLIALDAAVQYLRSGEGESAIVCGANTHCWPGIFGFLSAQKMTSPNGRCATYTNEADGYVPAEGAAAFILKTKSAALRDGDRILGVIKATDVKHDGRSQGLVAPNVKAQIMMQKALLEKANLRPSDIDFIESHGTGTSLGDLIEIQGINEVFKNSHTPDNPLVIGASKTCVGHTELIAGLVGVLKTLGSFKGRAVPGLVQLTKENMNPSLECDVVPILIPDENVELKKDGPLRALVLSNGFAGSIAGAVFEAPTDDMQPEASNYIPETTPMIFVVSAKSPEALAAYLNKYLDFCLDTSPSLFHSVCYTSCIGREHYRYRFACVAHNMQDLIARIEERLQNPPVAFTTNARRILFGFPGQGCQYLGMGRSLATQYSGFMHILAEAAERASALTGYPILPYLVEETPPKGLPIDNSEVAQVCIFTFQYAMASWLETLGIQASAVMGHSLGEIAGCVNAGAFTFEIGLQFVVKRANSLRSDPAHPGGMVAIATTEERVAHYIAELDLKDRLSIAVYNAPDNNVVSGGMEAIDKLIATVKRDGIRTTKLAVAQGFHSSSIAPGLPPLRQWLDGHAGFMKELEKPIFSTVRAEEILKYRKLDTQYWIDHAQNAVRFLQTARLASNAPSIDVVVDVGPQPTIWSNMQSSEFSTKPRLAFTGKRGKDQVVAMLGGLSALFEKGFSLNFRLLHDQMLYEFTMTDIPTYPFQRVFNYPTFRANKNGSLGANEPSMKACPPSPSFVVDSALCDFLKQHLIEGRPVLPGAAMVDIFARAARSHWIKNFRFLAPLAVETPDTQVLAQVDSKGNCQLVLRNDPTIKICSGTISAESGTYIVKHVQQGAPSTHRMTNVEVYECFKNVEFGEPFRTIQRVEFWDTHADGHVVVEPTPSLIHDRIRKIDACLHMFAAITEQLAPPMPNASGAYLPTSLEDFRLHTNDIPTSFVCRYHLPLDISRGSRILNASFEVFSQTGDLLISCQKYSVAWVPRGVVHKEQKGVADESGSWFRNAWIARPLNTEKDQLRYKSDELLYIGNGLSPVLKVLHPLANDTTSLLLCGLQDEEIELAITGLRCQDVLVVLDLTQATQTPGTREWCLLCQQLVSFLKIFSLNKLRFSKLLAVTSWSTPVDLYMEGLDLFSDTKPLPNALIGSLFHGLARALNREPGFDVAISVLDLPSLDTLHNSELQDIISAELNTFETFVSYRTVASKSSLRRLVPALQKITHMPSQSPSGTAVVIGLDYTTVSFSIALMNAGVRQVIFLGEYKEVADEVRKALSNLPEDLKGYCAYRNVDLHDYDTLNAAFLDLNSRYGTLKHIVFNGVIDNDGSIHRISPPQFDQALRSNVTLAWSLHKIALQFKHTLNSFVLCQSVGILGGTAELASNAFFDSLVTYRHNCGLPGISLQLGSWKGTGSGSELEKKMNSSSGYALAVKAMSLPIPSQIISRLDVERISALPMLSRDPALASLLITSTEQCSSVKSKLSPEALDLLVPKLLRLALELQASEKLDLNIPLTSCGGDSITFAQFKGQILKELELEVPAMYLSEDYTIQDMITNIVETYALT